MKVLESQVDYKLDQPLDIGTPKKNAQLSKFTKRQNSFESNENSTQAGDSGFFNLTDDSLGKMQRELDCGIHKRKMTSDNFVDDDSF